MSKGHRVVTETDPPGEGGSIPGDAHATAQPVGAARRRLACARVRAGGGKGASEPSHRNNPRPARSEPTFRTVTGIGAVTVQKATAAAPIAACDGVTVQKDDIAASAPVHPRRRRGRAPERCRGAHGHPGRARHRADDHHPDRAVEDRAAGPARAQPAHALGRADRRDRGQHARVRLPVADHGERRDPARSWRATAATWRPLRLGLPLVPVVEERHLTPVQRRAFIIADNKIALNAGWSNEHAGRGAAGPRAASASTWASPGSARRRSRRSWRASHAAE